MTDPTHSAGDGHGRPARPTRSRPLAPATSQPPGAGAARPAPTPDGDVVPGDPLVPISVWHLPRPARTVRDASVISAAVTRRLIANYTHPGATVLDLTTSVPATAPCDTPAELVITQWPPVPGTTTVTPATAENTNRDTGGAGEVAPDPSGHLAACAARLTAPGYLAVAVAEPGIHDLLGVLVTAGHAAGLTYLQHIVVVHHLPAPPGPAPGHAAVRRLPGGARHLRVHTDLLLFATGPSGAAHA